MVGRKRCLCPFRVRQWIALCCSINVLNERPRRCSGCRSVLFKPGPKSAEFARLWSNLCPPWVGPNAPDQGHNSHPTTLGPILSNIGQRSRPNLDRVWANLARCWPSLGQFRPSSAKFDKESIRSGPGVDRMCVHFDRSCQNFAPRSGRRVANFDCIWKTNIDQWSSTSAFVTHAPEGAG